MTLKKGEAGAPVRLHVRRRHAWTPPPRRRGSARSTGPRQPRRPRPRRRARSAGRRSRRDSRGGGDRSSGRRPHRRRPRSRRSSRRFARSTPEIGGLVEKGDFAAIWVPAFQAKDLALALEPHLAHLLEDARASAEPALFRLVQGAWRLDAVGDTGNRAEVELAFRLFGEALADVSGRVPHAVSSCTHATRWSSPSEPLAVVGWLGTEHARRTSRSRRRSPSTRTCCRSRASAVRRVPRTRRHRADVAPQPRERGALGRVDAARAGGRPHAAVGVCVACRTASATRRRLTRPRAERAPDLGGRAAHPRATRQGRIPTRPSRNQRSGRSARRNRRWPLPSMDLPADVARTIKEWVLPLQAFAGRRLAGVDLRPGHAVGRAQRAHLDAASRRRGRDCRRAPRRAVGARRPAVALARWRGVDHRTRHRAGGPRVLSQALGSRARAGLRPEHARVLLHRRRRTRCRRR